MSDPLEGQVRHETIGRVLKITIANATKKNSFTRHQ